MELKNVRLGRGAESLPDFTRNEPKLKKMQENQYFFELCHVSDGTETDAFCYGMGRETRCRNRNENGIIFYSFFHVFRLKTGIFGAAWTAEAALYGAIWIFFRGEVDYRGADL
ncbi:MAG: hypothetical protein LUG99_09150 [Lachnospiraceae bacterium]|nr:hypothetical protein [Lachnospiraceae bacterium]